MIKLGLTITPMDPIQQLINQTRQAESQGFSSVWVADNYWSHNAFVILSAIALNTNTIQLGPLATNPYGINPAYIASLTNSLNSLSAGRTSLSLGSGDLLSLSAIGEERIKPLEALQEAILIIRKLLNGEKVSYEGNIFRCDQAQLRITPKTTIPLYIGGRGPRILRLAGQVADGILIGLSNPEEIQQCIQYVKKGLKDVNRALKQIYVAPLVMIAMHDDPEKAREMAIRPVSSMAVNLHPEIIRRRGLTTAIEQLKPLLAQSASIQHLASVIDDKLIDSLVVAGDKEYCEHQIRKIMKLEITHLVLDPFTNTEGIITLGSRLLTEDE